MERLRCVMAGAVLGLLLIPALVYGGAAALHFLRFGHLREFWGEIPALCSIPGGLAAGAFLGYLRCRR